MISTPDETDESDGTVRQPTDDGGPTRRAYLGSLGAIATAGATAGCIELATGEGGGDTTEFTAGTFAHEGGHCMDCVSPSPGWAISEALEDRSDGDVQMSLLGENQVCDSSTCGGKAERGIVEAGYGSIGNGTNFWPENNVWLLPYTFPSRAALSYTLFDERIWEQYWVPFAQRYGIVPFYGWTPELRNLLLSPDATEIAGGRVRTPEDLEGIRIRRTASRPPKVALEEWGATAPELSWGDTVQGMDTGVVHGLETWSGVGLAGGMGEVMDQVTLVEFMCGQGVMWASTDWLQGLPADHRELIADVTRELTEEAIQQADEVIDDRVGHDDPPPEGTDYAEQGITVNVLEDDELEAWRERVDPMDNPELYETERERVADLDLDVPTEDFYEYIYEIARESDVPESAADVTVDAWWGEYLDRI
ncbi:TRAP transporter substrate-binding protein [Natronolimnohabitans innermongolicus]|uniref:Extracellular solute-binding protein, family 7 n=1 Tax=Natronolimnohabitans innermongolicus JCM 12255 TaxID=1227499 RepID=L9X3B9_9EURY|nr:ABC transporter substrate-binding protein [Natronolimnohabitans innermongolicus]ELY55961.1 Extracellular solute-binding protein, family 7 [Natronolimnohabitans innermongolicus JCM 12255]